MKVWRQLKATSGRRAEAAHRPMTRLWQRYFAAYLEPRMPAEVMVERLRGKVVDAHASDGFVDRALQALGAVQVYGDQVRWEPKPA